ncbi:hypothetical protein BC828DRAFT_385668 [Blastocladiella britannica]|nr:hypothetical protein BC828DRAFT_385668 [Blastocladiella britannica]
MLLTPTTKLPADHFSPKGITISSEERTCLATSLLALQGSQRHEWVQLWGKILAADCAKDYYLAIAGSHADPTVIAAVFVSQDSLNWAQAPEVSSEEIAATAEMRAVMTGDPAFEHALAPLADGTIRPSLAELKRVTAIVHLVHRDVTIAPRGAYVRDHLGKLVANTTYSGLRSHDVGKLSAYVHVAAASHQDPVTGSAHEQGVRADFEDAVDSGMVAIEADAPKGCWVVEHRPLAAIVSSLVWPGYHHFSGACDGEQLSFYVGNGRKNQDIGFML